jgi:hypothetical protein
LPGMEPGQYRIMARVTASYLRDGSRAQMSNARDMMFHVGETESGVAVRSITAARDR